MAISTYNTVLKYGASTPTTPITIKSFPSLIGEKSSLETTTLSDAAQTFIEGIRQTPDNFPFTANWDKTVFDTLNKLTGVQKCELDFSDGSKFTWDGLISVSNNEGGVDEVTEMTINIKPTTVVAFVVGTGS